MATVLPQFNRFAGLQQGALNFVQGLQQQRQQQALQQFAQRQGVQDTSNLPPQFLQQFLLNRQQQQARAGLQATKGITPSQTNLIGTIGRKIADGTATEGEMNVFNRLTEKAGTEITINNIEQLSPNIQTQITALKESQNLINEFTADPANADILKNSNVNVITNTKGQLQLEVKPKGAPAAIQIKELTDLVGLRNSMRTIDTMFDESFVGLVEGNPLLRGIGETTGIDVIESVKQGRHVLLTSKQIQFSRIVNDLSDRLLRARSGAQINEQEFKRLEKIVPTLGLSEVAFKARAKDFARELDNIIAIKEKGIEQAGQRPLRLQANIITPTLRQQAITTPKTQAEFDAIPSGTEFIDTDGRRVRKR